MKDKKRVLTLTSEKRSLSNNITQSIIFPYGKKLFFYIFWDTPAKY